LGAKSVAGIVLAGFLLFFPWMLIKLMGYTSSILGNLAQYAR